MAVALFALAAVTNHQPNNFWYSCSDVNRLHCKSHLMPKHRGQREFGFWTDCRKRCVIYPFWKRHVKLRSAYRQVTRAVSAYSVPMLVTYYLATGSPMSNGIYPSVGWAACGWDLPLGARVSVPGVGVLTCGDRIGFQPWRHIDVFGLELGTGYRMVTVLR